MPRFVRAARRKKAVRGSTLTPVVTKTTATMIQL